MADLKSKLIETYRIASSPFRAWQMYSRRKRGQVPVFVVFYHRVCDTVDNPWSMTCREFEQQIDWCEKHFQIVSLEECQRRIRSGHNTQPTLSITFDDGYSENCDFALPMLIERRIPVTYFVTTSHCIGQQPFPHDVERGEILPVNTIESLRALDIAGIEIGAHSRSHIDFGKVTDNDQLVDEVITATRELSDEIGRKIRYFAFPYGQRENLNPAVFHLLKREGFLGACTTINGWNEIGDDAFQISRLHGDPCIARMRNWLGYDPRLAKAKKIIIGPDQTAPLESKSKIIIPNTQSVAPIITQSSPNVAN